MTIVFKKDQPMARPCCVCGGDVAIWTQKSVSARTDFGEFSVYMHAECSGEENKDIIYAALKQACEEGKTKG